MSLEGKTIVITGGSAGIGAAAAKELRRRGATVALTGRSPSTSRLAQELGAHPFLVDFADFAQVRAFAHAVLKAFPRIDVWVNNVGGIFGERKETKDGHEWTLQVNHLSPFLLTSLLQERLSSSRASIINTSSAAHLWGRIRDFDALERTASYSAMPAYGATKLMNILHVVELQRRFGESISAAAFHPGLVSTEFARDGGFWTSAFYKARVVKWFSRTPEQGADTLVWLASAQPGKDWVPGGYYLNRKPGFRSGQAKDAGLAQRLWAYSERAVGLPP